MLYLGMRLVINLFLLAMPVTASTGQIIYVDDDAKGANNGLSWADSYNYLQDALAFATYGDSIHVAQGIYTPDRGVGFTAGDKQAKFSLKNGVAIQGGFAGFAEPDPNSRDIERYRTTLSGDLAGNDTDVNNPNDPKYRTLYNDNSYTVVTGSGTDGSAVLDGFTISGSSVYIYFDRIGPGGELRPPDPHGGMFNWAGSPTVINCTFTGNKSPGMYNANSSSPTLINCTFEKNYDGGIENINSNPKLIGCEFSDHFGLSGNVAMINDVSSPTLTRCLFSDNLAGATYNYKSSPALNQCTFIRNSVNGTGGAMSNEDSNPTLVHCIFTENTASYYAGAISNDGGQLTVEGCVFAKNYPGAIHDYSKSGSVFTNCTFSGNSAPFDGGAAVRASNVTFAHCLFAGNRALGYRDKDGTWLRSTGGAVFHFENAVFTNCTFSNNWAHFGCAIYCFGSAHMNNCILWGSGNQIYVDDPYAAPTSVRYSDVQGGWPGEGNIAVDPCFVDSGRWVNAGDPNQIIEPNDPNAVWIDGDYHLMSQAGRWDPSSASWARDDATSPCIDAGHVNSPIGFEPFPNGGRVNMGAYGGTAEASKSYFGEPICETIVAGDLNGDCKVDFEDLAILASRWLTEN